MKSTTIPHLSMLLCALVSGCMRSSDKPGRCPSGEGLRSYDLHANDLPDKTLSLTFDDGPSPFTAELLDGLKKEGVQATFFVIGEKAKESTDLLARMKAEGHLVANHTYSHGTLTASANPVAEVMYTDQVISPYVTGNMFLFRAPYGIIDGKVTERINREGITKYVGPVNWEIGDSGTDFKSDSECWQEDLSVEACAAFFEKEIASVRKGSILLHDNHDRSIRLVLNLIPTLKAQGYQFVRLDQAPTIRSMLTKNGGTPDLVGGPESCWDY